MNAKTVAERRWLLQFFGPKELADARPLTDAEAAQMGDILDRLEQALPAHAAIMDASDDQLETVVDRLIAEASR